MVILAPKSVPDRVGTSPNGLRIIKFDIKRRPIKNQLKSIIVLISINPNGDLS